MIIFAVIMLICSFWIFYMYLLERAKCLRMEVKHAIFLYCIELLVNEEASAEEAMQMQDELESTIEEPDRTIWRIFGTEKDIVPSDTWKKIRRNIL